MGPCDEGRSLRRINLLLNKMSQQEGQEYIKSQKLQHTNCENVTWTIRELSENFPGTFPEDSRKFPGTKVFLLSGATPLHLRFSVSASTAPAGLEHYSTAPPGVPAISAKFQLKWPPSNFCSFSTPLLYAGFSQHCSYWPKHYSTAPTGAPAISAKLQLKWPTSSFFLLFFRTAYPSRLPLAPTGKKIFLSAQCKYIKRIGPSRPACHNHSSRSHN